MCACFCWASVLIPFYQLEENILCLIIKFTSKNWLNNITNEWTHWSLFSFHKMEQWTNTKQQCGLYTSTLHALDTCSNCVVSKMLHICTILRILLKQYVYDGWKKNFALLQKLIFNDVTSLKSYTPCNAIATAYTHEICSARVPPY